MWVHIILFVLTFGIVLVWKAGWIRLDGIADRQSMRLFLLVAVCGNLLGMALTMTDGKDVVYQEGHRMEKNPDGAYTEELEVSVDGRKPQKFDVEIPEKETEETEVEPEQEVNETEQRQKELRNHRRIQSAETGSGLLLSAGSMGRSETYLAEVR